MHLKMKLRFQHSNCLWKKTSWTHNTGHQPYRHRFYAAQAKATPFEESFDGIVVGSGCAGLTAAVVMAKRGLKVLVVEKTAYFGGTTAYSGGGAWIPNNRHQRTIGVKDSVEKGDAYLSAVLGDLYEPANIKAFLHSGPQMIDWMEENTEIKFKPMPLPDYHLKKDGASVGRAVYTQPFNGRLLGKMIKKIRYPLQGYSAFGSLQADFQDHSKMTKPFDSLENFKYITGRMLGFFYDLLRYGKGTVMANGNALIGRLMYTLMQMNVEMWNNTPALRSILDDEGGVTGLVINRNGREIRVKANKGVILASGGFGRSPEARDYVPHEWCVSPRGNVGDGKRIGLESGGAMGKRNPENAIFAPISILQPNRGPVRRYPHFAIDRSKPGSIIVGPDGRRFANESEPYQEFVRTMHTLGLEKAFFIADRIFLRKYGMGMALPWPYPVFNLLRQGYLYQARTIPELAKLIGVPQKSLEETVTQCNRNAETGVDLQFQRGSSIYDTFYGDPSSGFRNPNLGPCSTGPFYALPLYPGNVSTTIGLVTDQDARVLSSESKVVQGLFAVGCDQNSITRGTYPAGGCSIGPGMTFGYRAGNFIAEKNYKLYQ